MHHSLRFYSRNREMILRYYMFQARWTRIPLLGSLVKAVANMYGAHASSAYLITKEEAGRIIDMAEGLALGPCTCRKVFKKCDGPIDAEIMLGMTRNVFIEERPEDYREIEADEAKRIIAMCHERGLIHALIRCRDDFYAICNCCPCCCVPLRLKKLYGIGGAITRHPDVSQLFSASLAERLPHA